MARTAGSDLGAQANFRITREAEAAATPSATVVPSDTPTVPAEETPTDTPTATSEPAPAAPTSTPIPQPEQATVTALTNLNVRSGPGLAYPVIGLLQTGQTARATGVSAGYNWWQIEFPGVAGQRGWISAAYVTAENTANLPIVVAPPLPAAPTATPAPVIVDWQGEYFTNIHLAGESALVRNDVTINFNWGAGSPAPGLPVDNFSARWSRAWSFDAGLYRFHAAMDDGVRLYVDNALVIDDWRDGARREVTGERWLDSGSHELRVEYYENVGDASIVIWAERIASGGGDDEEEPDADFDADRRTGDVPLRVEFDNDSDGDYDSCRWDFGDDNTSRDCDDPDHTYREPGRYTVKLRVRGPGGEDTKERDDYITVRPVAEFRADPRNGSQPLTVSFTNQSTPFYERSEWDFGDGNTSTAANPTHTYTAAGNYSVRLRVRANDVWSEPEIKTNYIAVTAAPPAVSFRATPTLGTPPLTVTFINDTLGPVSGWQWDFGDGGSSTAANPTHVYTATGEYSVSLTASGPGGSDTLTRSNFIIVVDSLPIARFSATPTSGPAPLTVAFTDNSLGAVTGWQWDFGDGSSSTAQNPTHTYGVTGSYTITLTATGPDGSNSLTRPNYVTVIEPAGSTGVQAQEAAAETAPILQIEPAMEPTAPPSLEPTAEPSTEPTSASPTSTPEPPALTPEPATPTPTPTTESPASTPPSPTETPTPPAEPSSPTPTLTEEPPTPTPTPTAEPPSPTPTRLTPTPTPVPPALPLESPAQNPPPPTPTLTPTPTGSPSQPSDQPERSQHHR